MDYQAELKRLEENESNMTGDFWKPDAGQYKVKALSEFQDAPPYEEEGKEPQPRKKIEISVNGNNITWTMPFGQTPASTYGQLIKLGVSKGKLKDTEFTVVVTGSGKNRRFTIVN